MAVRLLDRPTRSPLENLADDYLNHCAARGLSPRTVDRAYGYALHAVFLPWCAAEGVREVSELDMRAVDRFTASLLQRRRPDGNPISKYSVHTYVRPVRQMLTWASRMGEDVRAKPQLPTRSKPFRDTLTRDEIDRMEQFAGCERDKLIVRVFGDCGLRLDELVHLRAQDIVRSGRQAHLRVTGKRNRIRDVPVPPTLLRRLDRYADVRPTGVTTDRIFLSLRRGAGGEYAALTKDGVYQVIRDAASRSGLQKRIHPHLLRHSWMTEMLRNGMNPIQLSVIAGASMPVIAEHYTHLTKDDAYEAMLRVLQPRAAH